MGSRSEPRICLGHRRAARRRRRDLSRAWRRGRRHFLNQYQQSGGKAHLLGGSIMVDQTILSAKGNAKNALIGTIAASGQADTWEDRHGRLS